MTTYMNTEITRTDVTCLNNGRKCYALSGAVNKEASKRPFITSLTQARGYIADLLAEVPGDIR